MKPFVGPFVGHMNNQEFLARVVKHETIKNHLLAQLPARERALFNESLARLHARFPNLSKNLN